MTRYLARRTGEDGVTRMVEVTKEEWRGIVAENAGKPGAQKRKFIPDMIIEDGKMDCLVVEATQEAYKAWDAKRQQYNRSKKPDRGFTVLSMDNVIDINTGVTYKDTLPCETVFEEQVEGDLFIEELRKVIVQWKFWGPVLLDYYLTGRKRECTHEFAAMLGVSEQTARAYKREFEAFVKQYAVKHSSLRIAA